MFFSREYDVCSFPDSIPPPGAKVGEEFNRPLRRGEPDSNVLLASLAALCEKET